METKTIKTSKPIVIKSTQEPEPQNTLVVGDGTVPEESESPTIVVTPDNNLSSPSPSIEATPVPTHIPTPIPVPTKEPIQVAVATPIPTPIPISTPVPTPKAKQVYFKVRIGTFDSRMEAETKEKELEGIGYSGSILEDSEGIYIQLASFKDQDRALNLAEEISQRGYSVIIRQIEE